WKHSARATWSPAATTRYCRIGRNTARPSPISSGSACRNRSPTRSCTTTRSNCSASNIEGWRPPPPQPSPVYTAEGVRRAAADGWGQARLLSGAPAVREGGLGAGDEFEERRPAALVDAAGAQDRRADLGRVGHALAPAAEIGSQIRVA